MKPTNQTPLDEATRQISALLGEQLGSTLAGLFDLMGIAEDEISAAMVSHRVYTPASFTQPCPASALMTPPP